MKSTLALLLFGLLGLTLAPATADAAFVDSSGTNMEVLDAGGQPETQAGAHPDRMITRFSFTKGSNGLPAENIKDIYLDLPPGFSGDPLAVPYCPRGKLPQEECPKESQVGLAKMTFSLLGEIELPIFNVEPAGNEIAEVSFSAFILQGRFRIGLRANDSGMRMEASEFGQEIPLLDGEIELWGVPADHQSESAVPRRAFLSMPTSCGATPAAVLGTRTWQQPSTWETTPLPLPELGGCSALSFSPAFSVAPSNFDADSPTGLELLLEMPQNEDPDGVMSDQLRSLSVTLPQGFSLSPSVAGGLLSCSDAQLGIGADVPADCPSAARIGSVRLQSPALAGELTGRVYIAATGIGEPFRAFVVIERPGMRIKMPVELRADAAGALTARLTNMPQLPVSVLSIVFDGGSRAPLASPPGCGSGAVQAALLTYGGAAATLGSRVLTVREPGGQPCGRGRPFAPSLSAGSTSPVAGRSAGFSITLGRRVGEQMLADIRIQMPAGVVADTTRVPRCDEKAIVAAKCPAASRIGSTVVAAGPGPAPLTISGGVYFTGPFRGAPFGLAMLVPINVGPFQLGTAVIRSTLSIDAVSGRLTVATDPLPTVIEGIPLRIRVLGIDIDRPGFIRNPTSCEAGSVDAEVVSAEGATAWPAAPFQVGNCNHLRFAPKISLDLSAGSSRQPGLRIGIRSRGGANLRSLIMRLPEILRGKPGLAAAACPRERYLRGSCPQTSLVGHAVARTPLLADALEGSVHLVQASAVGTPQLWTELRGSGVRLLTTTATSVSASGRLITRVRSLPDFPLSSFTTTLRSGARSLFKTAEPVCKGMHLFAETDAAAHSGSRSTQIVPIKGLRFCR